MIGSSAATMMVWSRNLTTKCGVYSVFLIVALYSVWSGNQWKSRVEIEQANDPIEHAEKRDAWFEALARVHQGEDVSSALARPMNLPVLVLRPPSTLSHLAFSREDLFPSATTINGFSNEALLFRRYELESPRALMTGDLDFVFVTVVLLPLMLLILNFDNLSADRESGRLRILIVQGCRPARLLWSRTVANSLPLLLILLLVLTYAAIISSPMNLDVWSRIAAWGILTGIYWYFWVAVCACTAACFSKTLNAALFSISSWVLIVIVLASVVHFATSSLDRSPSRLHLLALARNAEGQALQSVDQRVEAFLAEHGAEMPPTTENVAAYYRQAYLGNEAINEKIGQLNDEYAKARHRNLRFLDYFGLFSPATIIVRSLQELAGTGVQHALNFEVQVREFYRKYFETIGIASVQQRRLTWGEAQSIGQFEYRESMMSPRVWSGMLWLSMYSVMFTLVGYRLSKNIERKLV